MHQHRCKKCDESIDCTGYKLSECGSPRLTYCMACYEEADAGEQTMMEAFFRKS